MADEPTGAVNSNPWEGEAARRLHHPPTGISAKCQDQELNAMWLGADGMYQDGQKISTEIAPAELRPPVEHADKLLHWVRHPSGKELVAEWDNEEGGRWEFIGVDRFYHAADLLPGYRYLGPAEWRGWQGPKSFSGYVHQATALIAEQQARIAELEAEVARGSEIIKAHRDTLMQIEPSGALLPLWRTDFVAGTTGLHPRWSEDVAEWIAENGTFAAYQRRIEELEAEVARLIALTPDTIAEAYVKGEAIRRALIAQDAATGATLAFLKVDMLHGDQSHLLERSAGAVQGGDPALAAPLLPRTPDAADLSRYRALGLLADCVVKRQDASNAEILPNGPACIPKQDAAFAPSGNAQTGLAALIAQGAATGALPSRTHEQDRPGHEALGVRRTDLGAAGYQYLVVPIGTLTGEQKVEADRQLARSMQRVVPEHGRMWWSDADGFHVHGVYPPIGEPTLPVCGNPDYHSGWAARLDNLPLGPAAAGAFLAGWNDTDAMLTRRNAAMAEALMQSQPTAAVRVLSAEGEPPLRYLGLPELIRLVSPTPPRKGEFVTCERGCLVCEVMEEGRPIGLGLGSWRIETLPHLGWSGDQLVMFADADLAAPHRCSCGAEWFRGPHTGQPRSSIHIKGRGWA